MEQQNKLYSVYYNELEVHTNEYVLKAKSKKDAKEKIESLIKTQNNMDDTVARRKAFDELMEYHIGGEITPVDYEYLKTNYPDLSEHDGLKYRCWVDSYREGRLTEEYIEKLGEIYGTTK
jgi:hypothetical protein